MIFIWSSARIQKGGGDRDSTEDVLTRPLLPNQPPEVEIGRYAHQRKGHRHLIASNGDVCPSALSDFLSPLQTTGLEEFYFTLNYHCAYHPV